MSDDAAVPLPLHELLEALDAWQSEPGSAATRAVQHAFGRLFAAYDVSGAWWRNGWRSGLLLAYLVGLASLPVLAYLTYLEIFVIGAICAWCVAYAVTVVLAWLVSLRAMSHRAGGERQPAGAGDAA